MRVVSLPANLMLGLGKIKNNNMGTYFSDTILILRQWSGISFMVYSLDIQLGYLNIFSFNWLVEMDISKYSHSNKKGRWSTTSADEQKTLQIKLLLNGILSSSET